ncbi:aldo/keto reductase [Dactylosporangium sp. CA-233914]|uniref:aldo/keto reductase n=1 Tax=Dactylosporangium sp. CA-233914 TaxID=3239934 RepID=UPI003D8A2553
MILNRLGDSGLLVPQLALGTGTFGGPPYGTTSVDQAREIVARCLDAGVTLFDSADVYGAGEAQEILGAATEGRRDDLLISAKVGLPMGESAALRGTGRIHLTRSVENTLRRLRTDHVDLLHLHVFDAGTPAEETVRTLDRLVADGKVRYLGVSNYAAWQLVKTQAVAEALGAERIVSQQCYYSLVGRDFELDLMPVGLDQGVGTLVWSPLAGGWLTGAIRRGVPAAPGSRVDRVGAYGPPVPEEVLFAVVDVLDEIAGETGRTIPQIAINWLLQRPTVASVVMGADDLDQLESNLGAVGWDLSDEQVARLDAASTTLPPYPTYMYHRDPGFTDLAPPPIRRSW